MNLSRHTVRDLAGFGLPVGVDTMSSADDIDDALAAAQRGR